VLQPGQARGAARSNANARWANHRYAFRELLCRVRRHQHVASCRCPQRLQILCISSHLAGEVDGEVDCKLPTDLEYEMLLYERSIFRSALVNAQGSLIQAARSVGLKPGKLFRRLRVEHRPLIHRLRPPVNLPRQV
jgi:hypothetical protein